MPRFLLITLRFRRRCSPPRFAAATAAAAFPLLLRYAAIVATMLAKRAGGRVWREIVGMPTDCRHFLAASLMPPC